MSRSLGQFAKTVATAAVNPQAASGLNTVTPSEGGFLVPQEQSDILLAKAVNDNAILSRVGRVVPDATNGTAFVPLVAESSRVDGSRYGGQSIAWLEEGAALSTSKPAFGRLDLRRKRCAGLCAVSDEMLRSNPATLAGYLEPLFIEALGDALAHAVVNGNGAGQPQGLLASPAKVEVTRAGSNAIAAADVKNMVGRLWGGSYGSAVWLCNESAMPQLLALSGSLLTFEGGMRLAGQPVVPTEHCPTLGTTGDVVLVDLAAYQLSAGSMQLAFSEHLGFEDCEGHYRISVHADGCLSWSTAVSPRSGGSDTLSPVVVLS